MTATTKSEYNIGETCTEDVEKITTDEDDLLSKVNINFVVTPFEGARITSRSPRWTGNGKRRKGIDGVRNNSAIEDDYFADDYYYIASYSQHQIHETMLKDRVRTLTYRDAICLNKHLFQGKTVLDIGCGTGILSMFAAQAGAARVIGIDFSDMALFARRIVSDNKLDSVVTIIHGRVEDTELPDQVDKVDIIISEWMGYSLLMESMLETVLYARTKWLKYNGFIFPDKCSLLITGIDDGEARKSKIEWLKSKACDFDMSHIAYMKRHDAIVTQVTASQVVTSHYELLEINLNTVYEEELTFKLPFTLEVQECRTIHALVTFFTVDFSCCQTRIGFSTAPEAEATHWKQTVFYLNNHIVAKKGEVVHGVFTLRKYRHNQRGLDIKIDISFHGELMTLKESKSFLLH